LREIKGFKAAVVEEKYQIDIKEIKRLAQRFSLKDIDSCINQQLNEGSNLCEISGTTDYIISELAKAEFVKQLMNNGFSITDAVRELARRIREFHQLSK
jgi:hypothetical protein